MVKIPARFCSLSSCMRELSVIFQHEVHGKDFLLALFFSQSEFLYCLIRIWKCVINFDRREDRWGQRPHCSEIRIDEGERSALYHLQR